MKITEFIRDGETVLLLEVKENGIAEESRSDPAQDGNNEQRGPGIDRDGRDVGRKSKLVAGRPDDGSSAVNSGELIN